MVDLVKQIATQKQATPAQIALAWLLAQKPFIAPIPGTTKKRRLQENVGSSSINLNHNDLSQIETALNNIEGMEISNIYPNPANTKLFIQIALDRSDNISIEIYNMIGIKLSENNMNLGIGNHMVMKDIDLNSGQYIVVIRDENGTTINTQQLVIVK